MKCPVCAEAELIQDTRDIPYTYQGESTVIPKVNGYFCSACEEAILDGQESKRVCDAMLEFKQCVISEETNYLMASPKNAERLNQAIAEVDAEKMGLNRHIEK